MKIIEALKLIKNLQRKASDLRNKVAMHSAYLSIETPVYENQKEKVAQWVQAHRDIIKEIQRLRVAIQKTNLETKVEIELENEKITKSIAEWIHRRRDLASGDRLMWQQLTDRGLREVPLKQSTGEILEVKIVRCYDPATRDMKIEEYTSEPSLIDGRLEIINAITDLIEE